MGVVGPVPLADKGGDLLGRQAVAGPHRGPRLPADRRSALETTAFSGTVQGVGFSLLVTLPAATLCLVPKSSVQPGAGHGCSPPAAAGEPARSGWTPSRGCPLTWGCGLS